MEEQQQTGTLQYDGPVRISVGSSRFSKTWQTQEMLWSGLVERLSRTNRTRETFAQYQQMSRDERGKRKDVGAYIGGTLRDGRRKSGHISWRSLITLDADYASPDLWDTLELLFGSAVAMYSTHSHSPERPKLRLVIPLAREVTSEEYEAVSRFVADEIGIEYFDDTTYQPERLMYWPSTAQDGEYLFGYLDAPWLDPDMILSGHPHWQDVSTWPKSSRVDRLKEKHGEQQGDPREKPGIVGAFCRVYDVPAAIETFLSDVYVPGESPERYTYTGGSTANGLIVYDGGLFSFSHHSTDPAGGLLCNAFDLVRIHKFSLRDEDVEEDTPVFRRPSYQEMEALALEDSAVRAELEEGRAASAREDFQEIIESARLGADSAARYLEESFQNDLKRALMYQHRKTGFAGLDVELGCLYPGLYVLGGTSSVGKTTFAHQLADQLIERGEHVLFFSLEQSRFELISKSLARLIAKKHGPREGISSASIRLGRAGQKVTEAREAYREPAERLTIIEGNFNITVKAIKAYVEAYAQEQECRPVVIVDYLQILPGDPRQSDKQRTDINVTELKRLSRDLDITVLVISSLNRGNYLAPVDFESFKESGGIEYSADVVLGLQLTCMNGLVDTKDVVKKRDAVKSAKGADPRRIELICLKNRNGKPHFSCEFEYYPGADLYRDTYFSKPGEEDLL